MNTSEVLNRAADLIEERGWVRGSKGWGIFRDDSPLCLEGGILAALGVKWDDVDLSEFVECPAYRAVESYLGIDFDPNGDLIEIWQWNDEDQRTANEVIEVLRACAVIEASREREAVEVSA